MLEDFDYWGWWRICVKEFKISPVDAWNLDLVSAMHLLDKQENKETDLSVGLRFRRKLNKAPEYWLNNKGNQCQQNH